MTQTATRHDRLNAICDKLEDLSDTLDRCPCQHTYPIQTCARCRRFEEAYARLFECEAPNI